jgi:hypothetical protein
LLAKDKRYSLFGPRIGGGKKVYNIIATGGDCSSVRNVSAKNDFEATQNFVVWREDERLE